MTSSRSGIFVWKQKRKLLKKRWRRGSQVMFVANEEHMLHQAWKS